MAERKKIKNFEIKSESSGRIKTGICSVFGNVDDWGDRMHPGSFTKTLSEGRLRAKHLWNHRFYDPPIASILDLKEIGRADLPPEVLAYAPTATGGLLVKREYYTKDESELAEWVFGAIQRGDIDEMSFGFDAVKYDYAVEDEKEIREIREVKLYDTSDVLWGMNDATSAAGLKMLMGINAEDYLAQLPLAIAEYAKNLKAGRRNAAADMTLIKSIHEAVKELGFDECQPNNESEKGNEAEAVKNDTSLHLAAANLEILKIKNLGVKI